MLSRMDHRTMRCCPTRHRGRAQRIYGQMLQAVLDRMERMAFHSDQRNQPWAGHKPCTLYNTLGLTCCIWLKIRGGSPGAEDPATRPGWPCCIERIKHAGWFSIFTNWRRGRWNRLSTESRKSFFSNTASAAVLGVSTESRATRPKTEELLEYFGTICVSGSFSRI